MEICPKEDISTYLADVGSSARLPRRVLQSKGGDNTGGERQVTERIASHRRVHVS